MPQASSLAFVKREAWLIGLLIVALAAALYHFNHPPDEFHEWRYTVTLMNAASYGQGADWLAPWVNWYGAVPRVAVVEFPLYQIVAYLLSHITSDLLVAARLVSVACTGASVFVFDRICALRGHPRRRVATVLFALSPLVIFQAHVPQPEALMLLSTLLAAYCALRAVAGGLEWAFGATVFLSVAATIKPTALVVVLPPLVYLALRRGSRARIAAMVAGAAIAFGLWALFARSVDLASDPDYFHIGTSAATMTPLLRFDPNFYQTLGGRAALLLLPPLLVGLVLSRAALRGDPWWWWWAAGSVISLEMFPALMQIHFYYQLPFVPALAALAAYGAPVWPRRTALRFGAAAVLVAATLTSLVGLFKENPIQVHAGRALAEVATPGRPVLVLDAYGLYYFPPALYYSGHPGWIMSTFTSAEVINQLAQPAPCEMVMVLDGPAPPTLPTGWREVTRTPEYVLGVRSAQSAGGPNPSGCPETGG